MTSVVVVSAEEDLTFFGAAAKAFASDTAMQVTTDAVQLLGGMWAIEDGEPDRVTTAIAIIKAVQD